AHEDLRKLLERPNGRLRVLFGHIAEDRVAQPMGVGLAGDGDDLASQDQPADDDRHPERQSREGLTVLTHSLTSSLGATHWQLERRQKGRNEALPSIPQQARPYATPGGCASGYPLPTVEDSPTPQGHTSYFSRSSEPQGPSERENRAHGPQGSLVLR